MAYHREASGSQVKRIMACPGSRRLMREKKEESSVYANEGTMLHSLMESRVREAYPQWTRGLSQPTPSGKIELTREQKTTLDECSEYFDKVIRDLEIETTILSISIEHTCDLTWADLPECGGSADIVIWCENKAVVLDWKFGKGVYVDGHENVQMLSYAAGAYTSRKHLLHASEVQMHLVQPRLNNYSIYTQTGAAILTWVEGVLTPAIKASREDDAPCIPGVDQCRWCVGVRCAERAKQMQQFAQDVFAPYAKKAKTVRDFIDEKELAPLLEYAKIADKFLKELQAVALEKAMTPEGFPGYKAVHGRGSRSWRNETEAREYLLSLADSPDYEFDDEDLFETKFISVAKAEKLEKGLKKDETFLSLFSKYPGKPTLVGESDPREAIASSAQAAFAEFAKKD